MPRLSQDDWLNEGLRVLAAEGADKLTIDVLTRRLGVTKGSFYHHFSHHQDFVQQLLLFLEQEGTLRIIQLTEMETSPHDKLVRLLELTTAEPPEFETLEIAFRGWALHYPPAREVQTRIDAERYAYTRQLCADLLGNIAQGERMARLLFTAYVGSRQVFPPLSFHALLELYAEIFRLYGIPTTQSEGI
jgi:AcrR family transcriptional regulator